MAGIDIRVTYDDNYTEEEILTHTVTVDNLPTSSSLKDVIDRQELLNSSIEVQKNNLKNILVGKNVEVAEEENKLSSLIDKVNELGDAPSPHLYLYKEGDECVDVTGGLVQKYLYNGSLTKNSNHIYMKGNYGLSGGYATLSTTNTIELTRYTKLCALVDVLSISTRGSFKLYVKQSFGDKPWDNNLGELGTTQIQNNMLLELDVTNFTGNYFVSFGTDGGSQGSGSVQVNVHKLWLEK